MNAPLHQSNTASFVIAAAERIKLRVHRTNEDVVAIGHDLLLVHEMLGAERFQEWIAEEFEMSRSAAYRFMQVAKKVPNPSVGLSATALYELAASPESVIEEVTERAKQGEVITASEVRQLREQMREVEQADSEPAPPHKLKSSPPRISESHSSHDAEVMALLVAWDAARQSAREAFLTIINSRDAADLSDDEHRGDEPEADGSGGRHSGDTRAARAGDEEGGVEVGGGSPLSPSQANGAGAAPSRNGGAVEKRSGVEEWPEIPAHLRRVA